MDLCSESPTGRCTASRDLKICSTINPEFRFVDRFAEANYMISNCKMFRGHFIGWIVDLRSILEIYDIAYDITFVEDTLLSLPRPRGHFENLYLINYKNLIKA